MQHAGATIVHVHYILTGGACIRRIKLLVLKHQLCLCLKNETCFFVVDVYSMHNAYHINRKFISLIFHAYTKLCLPYTCVFGNEHLILIINEISSLGAIISVLCVICLLYFVSL